MKRQINNAEYRALAEFRYRLRRFLRISEEFARSAGLEPQQHQLLLAIRGLPDGREPTIGELAERLQLQHHSAAELIDRAEERGLVQRVRGDADRRQVFVLLTREGAELLRRLSVHHRDELRTEGAELVRTLATLMESAAEARPAPAAMSTR